jgi:hypothetical protein
VAVRATGRKEEVAKKSEREQIEPRAGNKRYVRRDDKGRFTGDQVDVGRSRSQEARQAARGRTAKTTVKKGRGDKGRTA